MRKNKNLDIDLLEIYKNLTPTQCKIFDKLKESAGKKNQQIAREMYFEETTLEKHITKIGIILGKRGKGKLKQCLINHK